MQNSHKCLVMSQNVGGLRDPNKRRNIFSYLKDLGANFCFLQETFSNLSDENIWKNESGRGWGGEKSFFLTALAIVEVFVFLSIER